MRAWIGKYIAGVGILHCVFGLVVFRGVFADLIRDGLFNTVGWQPERGFAFWFVAVGFFWILLGAVLDRYERGGHSLPRFLGPALGVLALAGVVIMPISGWWLFFIPASALIFRSRNSGGAVYSFFLFVLSVSPLVLFGGCGPSLSSMSLDDRMRHMDEQKEKKFAGASMRRAIRENDVKKAGKLAKNPKMLNLPYPGWHDAERKAGQTPLLYAAGLGRTEIVKTLLEHGAGVNQTDKFGATALKAAVENGHADAVKLLLDRGADANLANAGAYFSEEPKRFHDKGETPLHAAVSSGRTEIVKLLLEKGADINAKTKSGMGINQSVGLTMGLGADMQTHPEVQKIRELLRIQMETPLRRAIRAGDIEAVARVLKEGAEVDEPGLYEYTEREGEKFVAHYKGETPLMFAAGLGQAEIVKVLLDHGADMNAAVQLTGGTVFTIKQMAGGNPEIAKILRDKCLEMSMKGEYCAGSLTDAAGSGQAETVKALLEKGADPNEKGPGGGSVLLYATLGEQTEIIKILQDHGADAEEALVKMHCDIENWKSTMAKVPQSAKTFLPMIARYRKGIATLEDSTGKKLSAISPELLICPEGPEAGSPASQSSFQKTLLEIQKELE